jgi:hypothetical protein
LFHGRDDGAVRSRVLGIRMGGDPASIFLR